jgi:D-3-phosphoglycerate dehydrogenase
MKAYVTPHLFPDLRAETAAMASLGGTLVEIESEDPDVIAEVVKDATALFVQYTPITSHIMESMECCRIIVRYGIGYDNIDLVAAGRKGIYVCNVPNYCGDEVADHTMALLLAAARKLTQVDRKVRNGEWGFLDVKPIISLNGKTLGLIGCGQIARRVAERAKAFGMRAIAFDPWVDREQSRNLGIEMVELAELCNKADVISLHLPLSADTQHIVNADLLNIMKKGVILVNTSRGGLVNAHDLAAAIEAGKVAVACLDVLEQEPPEKDHPLLNRENVILTPHYAYYSEESLPRLQALAAEEVLRVLRGQEPWFPVNRNWFVN